MDRFSKEKRSDIMSKIGGKNTKPEITVRSLLHRMGYRFRVHKIDLPGKPDICLPKYKTVIFVHGCYWHRHKECKRGRSMPSSNEEFWSKKFDGTIIRDEKQKRELQNLGWRVLIVWQCELSNLDAVRLKLREALTIS